MNPTEGGEETPVEETTEAPDEDAAPDEETEAAE